MDSTENMRRVLNACGAYKLDGSTMIDRELEAYGAGLEPVWERAAGLERDMFALTAGEERLGIWERLYRRQAAFGDIEARRRGVAAALSRRGGPVLAGDAEAILAVAGIEGSVRAEGGRLIITADSYNGATPAEAARLLGRLVPLHVGWEIVG